MPIVLLKQGVPKRTYGISFSACFPQLKTIKAELCDLRAVCVPVNLPITFWMPEPIIMKLGIYVTAPDSILTEHFINLSYQSVCLYVYLLSLLSKGSVKCIPPFIARQRLNKHVPASMNTLNNRRIVGRVCLPVYSPNDARSQLSKNVPVATKNWRHHFICGTFYVKGKYGIGSFHNLLFLRIIQKVGWIHPLLYAHDRVQFPLFRSHKLLSFNC
jgi:hypothetical protein